MKRMLIALALLMVLPATACKTVTTNPPIAPGYTSQADQVMGQTLAAAHAFYQNLQQDSAAGKITLTAPEKTALNNLGIAINVAQTAYLAFHNGTGTQAAAQTAVDNVQAKQATVQGLMPGVN